VRVLAHELPITLLIAAIQAAKMESILRETTKSRNCVHTDALRGRVRVGRNVPHFAARPWPGSRLKRPRGLLTSRKR
jgi:hypothetical protein